MSHHMLKPLAVACWLALTTNNVHADCLEDANTNFPPSLNWIHPESREPMLHGLCGTQDIVRAEEITRETKSAFEATPAILQRKLALINRLAFTTERQLIY